MDAIAAPKPKVLVEGDLIKEVSAKPIKAAKAKVVDCGKRTLMPGLIDCHVHVFLSEVNIRNLENVPLTLMTARAADLMKAMIDRGFTTVRDTGGADWGIKAAVDAGLIAGPRLFISGRAIYYSASALKTPRGATSCTSARAASLNARTLMSMRRTSGCTTIGSAGFCGNFAPVKARPASRSLA